MAPRSAPPNFSNIAIFRSLCEPRLGADEDQLAGMRWMTRRVRHGDLAAKRGSQYNWTLNAEHVAERADVVTPLRKRPSLLRAPVAATIAAVIQIDQLGA